jgi:hypothetical protein
MGRSKKQQQPEPAVDNAFNGDISRQIEEAVKRCFRDDDFASTLLEKLGDHLGRALAIDLQDTINDLKAECTSLRQELDSCKDEIRAMKREFSTKIDDQEQYTRRANLRVYGVPEGRSEDTNEIVIKLVKEKLNVQITRQDVDRSHRLGKPPIDGKKNSPRPIIVRFTSYAARSSVFKEKRRLKGSGVTIREDLTPKRREVLRKAVDVFGLRNAWSLDGKIFFVKDGRTVQATRLEEIK